MTLCRIFQQYVPAPHRIFISLIVLLVFLTYSNSLRGGFKWDDIALIRDNHTVKTWSNTPAIFLESNFGSNYYRPLQTFTYRIDYFFWKLNPAGYHLSNILLHLINASLVYVFVFLITGNKPGAGIAGMLFACHPALAEPVNYIASRSDLLVAMCILLVFIFYNLFSTKRQKTYSVISVCCFCLALLSKETALLVPLVLLSMESLTLKQYKNTIPYFLLSVIFLFLRQIVVPLQMTQAFNFRLLLSIPKAFLTYVEAFILPHDLHKTWHIQPASSPWHFDFIVPFAGLIALIFFGKKFFVRAKIALFGFLWFVIFLAPFSTILYLFCSFQAFPFSYAWVYTASVGGFLALASFLPRNLENKKLKNLIVKIVFLATATFFLLSTSKYNVMWAGSEIDFYKNILMHEPEAVISNIYVNMGRLYIEEKKYEEASEVLNKALAADPANTTALCNLGMALSRQKKYVEALQVFNRVLLFNPHDSRAFFGIGLISLEQDQLDAALKSFQKALDINPTDANIHYDLGLTYLKKNDVGSAVKEFEKTIRLEPSHLDAHYNLSILYARSDNLGKAIEEYKTVSRLNSEAYRH